MFTLNPPITTEIAPDIFRISLFAKEINLQFNYFVVNDEQPLLFTTGYRTGFATLRDAVAKVIDPTKLRWIGFSHFEADECGAMNNWLEIAPNAQPVCGMVSAMVNLTDFAIRPPKGMTDGELLHTGKHRFRFCATAQLPHGWDAGLLYEESQRILFCSDLFHQEGDVPAVTDGNLLDKVHAAMKNMQASPLADYMPYTRKTDAVLKKLGDLGPQTLAIMHGSTYRGDGNAALRGLSTVMRDVLA